MDTFVYALLGVTSVIGLGVIIWRAWVLRWENIVPANLATSAMDSEDGNDIENLRHTCESESSPLGRLLLLAIGHRNWSMADNEAAVETAARHEIVKLESGLVVLEIIVGIAPLLGLVGTILGMMNVFGDIGSTGLNNMNDASKLASGISLILRTTLIGLLISIPSLVAWSYFSKKVEVLAVEMETICAGFVRKQYAGKK
jgi:biopolymer transport protein ExbB